MHKMIAFLLALGFLHISVAANAGTREVQGAATGRNLVGKTWIDRPIGVCVDNEGNTYIRGGEGVFVARGLLYVEQRVRVIELLKKGLEWAKTAKKEKVEITKELGTFMRSKSYDDPNGIQLTFFSSNKGQQADVILYIVDFDNMFDTITLYLNPTQIKGLIALLEKVPQTLKELREQEKKSELFK